MTPPPKAFGTGGIELPPRLEQTQQEHQKQHDSERAQQKTSSDKVSLAELSLALQAQRAEDKSNSLEKWVASNDAITKDHGVRIVKIESTQQSAQLAKEARHNLRGVIIAGICTIIAGSGIGSIKACMSFRDELRTKAASVASGEVQRRQPTESQIRRDTMNELGPQLIKDALDEQDRRNDAKGLVLVPKDSLKAKPKKP